MDSAGQDIYVMSIRYLDSTDGFVSWFSICNSTILGAGKGLWNKLFQRVQTLEFTLVERCQRTVSDELMYSIYSPSGEP
jgi:hypothetical protein